MGFELVSVVTDGTVMAGAVMVAIWLIWTMTKCTMKPEEGKEKGTESSGRAVCRHAPSQKHPRTLRADRNTQRSSTLGVRTTDHTISGARCLTVGRLAVPRSGLLNERRPRWTPAGGPRKSLAFFTPLTNGK